MLSYFLTYTISVLFIPLFFSYLYHGILQDYHSLFSSNVPWHLSPLSPPPATCLHTHQIRSHFSEFLSLVLDLLENRAILCVISVAICHLRRVTPRLALSQPLPRRRYLQNGALGPVFCLGRMFLMVR